MFVFLQWQEKSIWQKEKIFAKVPELERRDYEE